MITTSLTLGGCHSHTSIETRYSEARKKLDQGYTDLAFRTASEELQHADTIDAAWSWRFRLIKAEASIRLGQPQAAVNLLEENPPSLSNDLLARRKTLLGQAHCQLKDFSGGMSLLEVAKDLAGADRSLLAEISLVKGKCEGAEGHLDLAREDYLRSEQLAENTNTFVQASATGNVAVLLMQEGHYDEAIDTFQKVLQASGAIDSPLLEQITLGNLGFCYSQLGDWKRATSLSETAARLAEKTNNLAAQERWLIDLGKAHYALWNLQDAETSYLHALAIAQQLNDHYGMAVAFHNLAQLALRKQDFDLADSYWQRGQNLKVESESTVLALDHAEIMAGRKRWSEARGLFENLESTTTTSPSIHSSAEIELGKVYWQQGDIRRADQMFRKVIAFAEDQLTLTNRIEYRLSVLDRARFYDPYIRFLVAQNRSPEALAIAERSRAQVWTQTEAQKHTIQRWTISSTQQLMPRNAAILAYWITNEESFLWAITSSRVKLFKLPGHLDLHRMIDDYNREIQEHHRISDSPSAERLYETLISPAKDLIRDGSRVIIVPSKVLSWVSFDALVVPGPAPHYWIENVDVQIAGSIAKIDSPRDGGQSSGQRKKQLLTLGAPVQVTQEFPILKHAPDEIRLVQSHFPADQETIISGKDATPQAYTSSDPGSYRFIHLDTHGTASDLSPFDSAIILSADGNNSYKLYAREIKDIPLHADLVTISACYGAGTRWYNNEGVVGLGWAFLRAGAHQVIAALWEVDDASSPQLMDDFYGELTQGKSAAEALRDAKLKMLHSSDFHRHPYYWASLQLYTGS